MREVKTFPLVELKITDSGDSGIFTGRASTFGSVDSYGDVVDPGAYKDTLPQFLTRGFIGWGHDWADPIGIVTEAEERSDGLYVTGQFHSDPEAQRWRTRARERVDAGKFMGLSIGYEAEEWEMREADPPVRNRWGELSDKLRALTKIKLFEVSLVTVPAEPMAGVAAVKGYGLDFDDHSEQLRVALLEFVARCKAGSVERVKVGRTISAARAAVIAGVSGSLRGHADELDGLMGAAPDDELEDPVVGVDAAPEGDLKLISDRIEVLLARYPPPKERPNALTA